MDHGDNKFSRWKITYKRYRVLPEFCQEEVLRINGVHREGFNLHLEESEFRFNSRDKDIYKLLLKDLNQNML